MRFNLASRALIVSAVLTAATAAWPVVPIGVPAPLVAKFTSVGLGETGTSLVNGVSRTIPSGFLGYHWVDNVKHVEGDAYGLCADFPAHVNTSYVPFSVSLTPDDGSALGHAGHIVATYFRTANTAAKTTGLQLAVWEALYDNGASIDFSGGNYSTSSFGSPADLGSAAYYASLYYGATSGRAIYAVPAVTPAGGQATLTAQAVPEPGLWQVLSVGAFGLSRRPRKKAGSNRRANNG